MKLTGENERFPAPSPPQQWEMILNPKILRPQPCFLFHVGA